MLKKILLTSIVFIISATSSYSDDITPNKSRLYNIYWGGLHIADMAGQVSENEFSLDIKSYGMVKKVSKYQSHSTLKFSEKNGTYIPERFFTTSTQRHGKRDIEIFYESNSDIKTEQVTPPDKRFKRPAVDDKMKKYVVDPLTAALKSRLLIKEALKNGENNFAFNIYDARRLSRLEFIVHGRETIELSGVNHEVIKMSFKRIAIAGYTKNELKRKEDEEPDFVVYLSDDSDLLPIKAIAKAPLGSAIINMQRDCKNLKECFNN